MIDTERTPERTIPDRRPRLIPDLADHARIVKRELIVLGAAVAAFLVILPLSAEANPEHDAAQRFLDNMMAATAAIQNGDIQAAEAGLSWPGLSGLEAPLDDGTVGTALVGDHDGRCFLVHWQSPGSSGVRAGVLDPALACQASPGLMQTLPTPPFIEVFAGTVPPLEAATLLSRVDEARHGAVEPFPQERTTAWFLPAAALLLGIAFWQLAGVVIKLLRRRLSRQRYGALDDETIPAAKQRSAVPAAPADDDEGPTIRLLDPQ